MSDARRRAILDAALACFLQFGYAKTSLDDIAKRAGISRPLLYRKFRNKEDIYGAVYEDIYEAMYPEVRAILAERRGSKRDKLVRVCDLLAVRVWELLWKAPAIEDFYEACERVIPEIREKHAKKHFEFAREILGDRETTEVFMLALDGLFVDLPTVNVVEKRIRVLIERFT